MCVVMCLALCDCRARRARSAKSCVALVARSFEAAELNITYSNINFLARRPAHANSGGHATHSMHPRLRLQRAEQLHFVLRQYFTLYLSSVICERCDVCHFFFVSIFEHSRRLPLTRRTGLLLACAASATHSTAMRPMNDAAPRPKS